MYRVVEGPIDGIALEEEVRTDADGAVIVFRGVARRHSRGRDVVHLEYEAYPEMAEKVMAQIGDEIKVGAVPPSIDPLETAKALIWMTERYLYHAFGPLNPVPAPRVIDTVHTVMVRTLYPTS